MIVSDIRQSPIRQSSQNMSKISDTNVNITEIENKNNQVNFDLRFKFENDFENYLKKRINNKNSKKSKEEKIILNARGIKYEVLLSVFEKLPKSRLGKLKIEIERVKKENRSEDVLMKLCDDYDFEKNEYYFNKDPYVLNVILNYYENDRLHICENICAQFYGEELLYWEIDENSIESCCHFKHFNQKDEIFSEIKIEKKEKNELINDQRQSFNEKKRSHLIKKKIWNLMEKPSSSYFARVTSNF